MKKKLWKICERFDEIIEKFGEILKLFYGDFTET